MRAFTRNARRILRLAFAAAALVLLSTPSAAPGAATERPPNILFILIDNLGKDWFGCYGSVEGQTPNIDRLAREGLQFEHCYVTPMCSTSRVVLLTGRYGFRTGWHTHHDTAIYGGGYLDWEREVVFARVLQSAGYATCITGKWQLNDLYDQKDALARHGFDEHLLWTGALNGEGNAETRWKNSLAAGNTTDNRIMESRYWDPVLFQNEKRLEATGEFGPALYVDYLIDFMERHRERPFLAYYSSPSVHRPLVATPLDPDPEDTSDRALWAGMVRYVDHQAGEMVRALDDLGLRDNTIVVITTDNGSWSGLGGRMSHGMVEGGLGKMTEPGLDVPLIVNCPGLIPEGRKLDVLVDGTDFFVTFAELGGANIPPHLVLDGRSFADLIRGEPLTENRRDWILSQYAGTRIIRSNRHKLYSTGGFFDVIADPLEKNDLAGASDPETVAARARLQAVLDGLPPDAKLPFEPRSSSAFSLERKREAREKKAAPGAKD